MHIRVLFVITVGMIGVGSVFAGGSAEDGADPIGFGGVWPLGDITGEEGSNGAQLAIDEINAAGWADIAERYPQIAIERWFLAYEDGPFGSASFEATRELFSDMDIAGESFQSAAGGGGDYTAVLERAKEYDPDVFIWAGYDADALPIGAGARDRFRAAALCRSASGMAGELRCIAARGRRNALRMWAPALNAVSDASAHFSASYVDAYGSDPSSYFAPLGYTAVMILAQAIASVGTLDSDVLIAELRTIEYDSPLGETITFTPSKVISNQGIRRQKILQWQNGRQEVLWPFELATTEPVYPFLF